MGGSALAVASMIAAAIARGGVLWVDFAPQSEACGYPELEAALRARLGDVDIRKGPHEVAHDEASVKLERDGAEWELRVRVNEEPELRRKLPDTGCVELTETSALVIERYLADIHWAGDSALAV